MSEARVLVVDDEPVVLHLVERLLRREGYDVTAVQTAEDALALLEAEPGSDLVVADATLAWTVVSDVRLPGMNGCALGREIVRRWPGTRMLFISGYFEEYLVAQGICPKNMPLLPKPFDFHELVDRVRATLLSPPWVPEPIVGEPWGFD